MKKKLIIGIIILILLILIIPIPNHLKDGGTIEYKSLVYKISKVHNRELESEHYDGTIIEILGKEVFNNVVVTHIERPKYFTNSELSLFALEYFFKTTPEDILPENVSKDEYHVGISDDVIEKYKNQDMVVIEIRHINNNINNTLDARFYINIYTAKGFDDLGNEIDLNL